MPLKLERNGEPAAIPLAPCNELLRTPSRVRYVTVHRSLEMIKEAVETVVS